MMAGNCSCNCCTEMIRKRFSFWQDVAKLKKNYEIEIANTNKLLIALRWIRAACNSPTATLTTVATACDRVLPQFRERDAQSIPQPSPPHHMEMSP